MFDLNDGQLDFDPYSEYSDAASPLALLSAVHQMAEADPPPLALVASPTDDYPSQSSTWKGKCVSRPVDIPPAPQTDPHDTFDIGGGSASHSDRQFYAISSLSPSSFAGSCPIDQENASCGSVTASNWKGDDAVPRASAASMPNPRDIFDMNEAESSRAFSSFSSHFSAMTGSPNVSLGQPSASTGHNDSAEPVGKGKGKEKQLSPALPPLPLTLPGFGYDNTNWPSPSALHETAGPSSFGSVTSAGPSSHHTFLAPLDLISVPAPPAPVVSTPTAVSHPLFRRRSLPSLTAGTSAKSRFRKKVNSSTLARKLLFKKYDGDSCPTPPSSPTDGRTVDLGAGNCFAPWRNDSAFRLEYESLPALKGRTDSLPFPVSALDLIPATPSDVFAPIPYLVVNYFDDVLPRELRVNVMLSLIAVHEADHARAVRDGQWTVTKATSSRNKWVGRDKAFRELVRFSRVSKSWQTLVFDGEIWANLDLHAFPLLPKSLLLRIARHAGSFVQNINVAGHVNLHSGPLIEVANHLSALSVSTGSLPFTHLTGINLRGCSSITTRSLHHLLIQSRTLERLCLKGLGAVTNTTCDIIAVYCTRLVVLDLGRCVNIDAGGIRSLATTALVREEYLALKELRLSGLKHVNDNTMAALGRAAPYLEVLDLSYVRQLHNTAVEAFVACRDDDEEDEEKGIRIVCLNAREAGRNVEESNKYRRRVTRLRHLILSSCILLTDAACSHLAHSVPQLEYLELAGIGSSIEDEGLIRLLNTTPSLKRLDLEDASSITDAVITALTPVPPEDQEQSDDQPNALPPAPEPESPLEHLIISGAVEVTDDALLALIRGCQSLRVLEADNTRMGPIVLKTFIRTVRRRALADAKLVAVDCRGFGEALLRDLAPQTRPRRGWVAYAARGLGYLDARDAPAEDLRAGQGQDECDEMRVVVKTFHGWQTVDAVQAAREKRRKARTRRTAHESSMSGASDADEGMGADRGTRWWSPGGRRSGANSPPTVAQAQTNEGCTIM